MLNANMGINNDSNEEKREAVEIIGVKTTSRRTRGRPCGACKLLRRKCTTDCIFAPYFSSNEGAASFAAVHKFFGASKVSKLLLDIPPNRRQEAVSTICCEAQARLSDPVNGCVADVFAMEQQLQQEVSCTWSPGNLLLLWVSVGLWQSITVSFA
jgi:hypothetical protein